MAAATVAPLEVVLRWEDRSSDESYSVTIRADIRWTAFLESVGNALALPINKFVALVDFIVLYEDEGAPHSMTISGMAEKFSWDVANFPVISIYADDPSKSDGDDDIRPEYSKLLRANLSVAINAEIASYLRMIEALKTQQRFEAGLCYTDEDTARSFRLATEAHVRAAQSDLDEKTEHHLMMKHRLYVMRRVVLGFRK